MADVALRDAERGRDVLFEDARIEPRLDGGDVVIFAQEVGGKGGGGDDVVAGWVDVHVFQRRNACFDQREAHRTGVVREVFAQDEQVDDVILARRFFDEVAVAVGKRVGIHDDGGDAASRHVFAAQRREVLRQAVQRVFKEIQLVFNVGDFAEPQPGKGIARACFGVHVAGGISGAVHVVHQRAHQGVEEAAALMFVVNGDTFQDVAVTRAGGNQRAVIVIDAIDRVQMRFATDAFAREQRLPGGAVGCNARRKKLLYQRALRGG